MSRKSRENIAPIPLEAGNRTPTLKDELNSLREGAREEQVREAFSVCPAQEAPHLMDPTHCKKSIMSEQPFSSRKPQNKRMSREISLMRHHLMPLNREKVTLPLNCGVNVILESELSSSPHYIFKLSKFNKKLRCIFFYSR